MQTPPNLNEQHLWGGQRLHPFPDNTQTDDDEQEKTTLVGHGQQDLRLRHSSHAGFIASSSDNLFNPVSDGPHTFQLPNVPLNPRSPPLPYPSSSSSYNNPSFAIPPPLNRLGPPPPIPPRPYMRSIPSQPVYEQFTSPNTAYIQPSFHHQNSHVDHCNHCSSHSSYSSSPALSPLSKTLPTVTHVPILTSKHDFFAWDEGVNSLIHANGLIGHILDPSAPVNLDRPDLAPTPIPILPATPSASDIAALSRWWAEDSIAQHILVSRLGSVPRGLLPSPNLVTRTALSIYMLLLQYYGTCNFSDCTELLNSLHNSTCTPGRVQEFVSKWRTGISRLQSAKFIFNIKICIGLFVRGLPSIPAFNSIRADLPLRIAAIGHDQDYGAFISMTERVLELDTIFRSVTQTQVPRQSRVAVVPAPATVQSSPAVPDPQAPSRISKPVQTCNNCKS